MNITDTMRTVKKVRQCIYQQPFLYDQSLFDGVNLFTTGTKYGVVEDAIILYGSVLYRKHFLNTF